MQKNKELQDLFNNYRNLSEDQLITMISLVSKMYLLVSMLYQDKLGTSFFFLFVRH